MVPRISVHCSRVARWLLAALVFPSLAAAQQPAAGAATARPLPTVRAVRSASPVVLDGRLDEPAWGEALAATGLLQSEPNEGQPATERTEIRIVYDDEAMYVGARMFDSEATKIRGRLSRRDDYHIDADYVTIYLDPHHDHLTGARFQVTAAGSLGDATLFNDTDEDESWDGVWDAKVTVDDKGWTAEIRIPFSQLRFASGEHQTWGLNVERSIRRKNESDWWELVLKKENGRVSRLGHLEGLDGIPPRPHLDLLPYTTARAEYVAPAPGDPFNSGRRYFGSAGLDLKWGVTSSLTLDGTVNPDFGQVEVDPAVVNLTAFETFYEEKRPFFTEGSNIFGNFGRSGTNSYDGFNRVDPTLFYSRRIGRSPQGPADGDFVDQPTATTILGAAKLTGKTASGWSVGLIDAVTGREAARVDSAGRELSVDVEPPTNYLVGRAKRDIANRSSVGVIFTSVARSLGASPLANILNSRAYMVGTDGHLFLDSKRDWVVHGLFAGSHVQGSPASIFGLQRNSAHYFQRPDAPQVSVDAARTSLSGWDGQLNLNKNSGDVTVNAALWGVSPGFEVNDAGYFRTADRAGVHGVLVWKRPTPDRWTRSRSLVSAAYSTWNFNRENQGSGYFLAVNTTLLNYWDIQGQAIASRSAFDDRLTRGGPSARKVPGWSFYTTIESDSRKRLGVELTGNHSFDTAGGFDSGVSLALDIRPSSSLTISTGPQITRGHSIAQYVRTVVDPLAVATFGSRYVCGDLNQTEVSMTTRVDLIFTPKASLQVYMQPLLSTGTYWNFKELAQARTLDFLIYGQSGSALSYDPRLRVYTADPDGAGPAPAFSFGAPDFNFKSLRVNAIFRWEWRLGSALYVVWTQQRQDLANPGDFALRRDISSMFGARGDNVFAVKLAYWLTR
jgi:Domain of unknown function (DUF5916)/Carbohydrate family 9 binding domain-like